MQLYYIPNPALVGKAAAEAQQQKNAVAVSDEMMLRTLKEKGVKCRRSLAECTTPEELQRYRLSERIKRRKMRGKSNPVVHLASQPVIPLVNTISTSKLSAEERNEIITWSRGNHSTERLSMGTVIRLSGIYDKLTEYDDSLTPLSAEDREYLKILESFMRLYR